MTRVTVSLDALDDTLFRRMNDADFAVDDVLEGIATAQAVGLAPVKVNMVVKRGTNDGEIVPMARHFKGSGCVLRFIEYMDVGTSNGWNMAEVLPSAEVVARIGEYFPLVPLEAHSAAETAQRWGYTDGSGEIGVISSVTRAFCGTCTRARLSTEGKLYLCLFASGGARPARAGAQWLERRTDRLRGRTYLAGPRRSLFRTARQQRCGHRNRWTSAASKCRTSAAEAVLPAALNLLPANLTGLVLAGGRGTRMGGVDKGTATAARRSARFARHEATRAADRSTAHQRQSSSGGLCRARLAIWRERRGRQRGGVPRPAGGPA